MSSPAPPPSGFSAARISRNLALHAAAAAGDFARAKELLDEGADVWYEDEGTLGWDALHFAAEKGDAKTCRLLLRRGAIWNAVDVNGYTAAEVAWSLNDAVTYQTILDEAVRQTVIRNVLAQKAEQERLERGGSEAEAGAEEGEEASGEASGSADAQPASASSGTAQIGADGTLVLRADSGGEVGVDQHAFLSSKLRFELGADGKERCVDRDGGVVMAAWETDIMARTASLLCEGQKEGFSALNIGFGLGIIDGFIQRYKPGRHVIVEPHPDVLAHLRAKGWDKLPGVEIWERRWQDCLDELGDFDVIYTDTYSEDYMSLRSFFEELPNLVSGPDARFSFFHGLAGTNRFLYDVYTRVAELDLRGIGLGTTWEEVRPSTTEETWEGTLRKYWSLDVFRIPICRMNVF